MQVTVQSRSLYYTPSVSPGLLPEPGVREMSPVFATLHRQISGAHTQVWESQELHDSVHAIND